jgi:DNA polymerase IV
MGSFCIHNFVLYFMLRKIIHIDMDAFYASVEQRDFPELRGKAVAVGYGGSRGVVATASYEARKYGVRSAMPSVTALRKCPHLIFVPPRFEVYQQVSAQIRAILYEYTDLVEPVSLDEAYLDVSENKKKLYSATLIAREIKQRIKESTELTASAGVSINKFMAKIASELQKPDGLCVIPPEKVEAFIETLAIEKFHGIGKVTAQKMQKLGIFTGLDLKNMHKTDLIRLFGKAGTWYYYLVRGIDDRPVNPHQIRKSFGSETTFTEDLTTLNQLRTELAKIAGGLMQALLKRELWGRTLTLKVKFADFTQITRSKTLSYRIDNLGLMQKLYEELLNTFSHEYMQVRLLGLSVSNFEEKLTTNGIQLSLEF